MNKRYTGPIRNVAFDEGMGIAEDPVEPPPPSAPTTT